MDETPSYMDTSTQKPSKKKTIWLILIIVALIASNVSWALFFFKQQGELTTKNNILLAKVAKLEKENKDLESKSNQTSADSEYREIPELGVKYKIDADNINLSYAYATDEIYQRGGGHKSIALATAELIDAGCGFTEFNGEAVDEGMLGGWTKYSEGDMIDPDPYDDSTSKQKISQYYKTLVNSQDSDNLIKQVGKDYIIQTVAPAACDGAELNAIQKKAGKMATKTLEALEPID